MSNVTNVILATLDEDCESLRNAINAGEEIWGTGIFFQALSGMETGGTEYMECTLYVGGFNCLDIEAMKRHLATIDWEWPETVQLLWRGQEADFFESWRLVEEKACSPLI